MLRLVGLCVVGIALTFGLGQSQETRRGSKKVDVPRGWDELKLSAGQRDRIIAISTACDAKIAAVRKQIDDLEREQLAAQVKLLTDEQKAALLKDLTGNRRQQKDNAPVKEK